MQFFQSSWRLALGIHGQMKSLLRDWPEVMATFSIPCPRCRAEGELEPCTFSDEYLWQPCRERLRCKIKMTETVDPSDLYPPEEVFKEFQVQGETPAPGGLAGNTGADERYNYQRVASLVSGYGPELLCEILRAAIQPLGLTHWLLFNQTSMYQALKDLPMDTYGRLYPDNGHTVQFTDLTFNDMLNLITNNIVRVPPPRTGWTSKHLTDSDVSLGANILRLKELHVSSIGIAHASKGYNSDTFNKEWAKAEKVIFALGGEQDRVSKIKAGGIY